ncbi:hypothetical protein BCR44DRAFT_1435842 [Catenaria anguillulae PL171]|uniref:Uncharacterized protein n=1 Tax=Catenaria anguillulae PL171 TaxID=765915 RepID=A0A1Y2HLV0_9FUNG|nr:hypothetical protein BCR44DRAFT_1435842 [Catenaria anguillulae PL171]
MPRRLHSHPTAPVGHTSPRRPQHGPGQVQVPKPQNRAPLDGPAQRDRGYMCVSVIRCAARNTQWAPPCRSYPQVPHGLAVSRPAPCARRQAVLGFTH